MKTPGKSSRINSPDTSHKRPEFGHQPSGLSHGPFMTSYNGYRRRHIRSPLCPGLSAQPRRGRHFSENQNIQAYPPAHPWSIRISHSFKPGCGRRFRQVLRAEEDFAAGPDLLQSRTLCNRIDQVCCGSVPVAHTTHAAAIKTSVPAESTDFDE